MTPKAVAVQNNLKIVVGKTRRKTYICFMTARQSFFGTFFYYFFFGKRPGLLLLKIN
jgi:hypothetical protein